jgi:hypothetical protein
MSPLVKRSNSMMSLSSLTRMVNSIHPAHVRRVGAKTTTKSGRLGASPTSLVLESFHYPIEHSVEDCPARVRALAEIRARRQKHGVN